MRGHVFILRGDISALASDAQLIPSSREGTLDPARWFRAAGWPAAASLPPPVPSAYRRGRQRVTAVEPWPDDRPRLFLAAVSGHRKRRVSWYLEAVAEFLEAAAATFAAAPRLLARRERPLLALPVIGTGRGGQKHAAGAVLSELLPLLIERAAALELDIALVAFDAATFAAAQAVRRDLPGAWSALEPRLWEAARRLAEDASRGRLALFLGAGTSMGAGLPSWDALLETLADRAGLSEEETRALRQLHPLDRAEVLRRRLPDQEDLGGSIAGILDRPFHALAHGLLANLPCREQVTLNFDTLFEEALAAAGRRVAVLPYDAAGRGAWLLKLHGSVERPDDIVITRSDDLRYVDRRAALAGVVQSLLLTRRLLFVGFSLTDDNFHRISDAARKALPARPGEPPFGTSLQLVENPFLHELWSADVALLDMVSAAEARGATLDEGALLARAARRLEVFLDALLAQTHWSRAHLLEPRFAPSLRPEEAELAEVLQGFAQALEGVSAKARGTPLFEDMRAFLDEFRDAGG